MVQYLEFSNMYKGLKRSCKNVRWKTSVTQYEVNGLRNTAKLIRDIQAGKYKLSPYQEFEIYEPKWRHITATRIKDRQVQRSFCDTTFYAAITKPFVYDNCACQIGKGTVFAMQRLKKQLQRYYRKHGSNEGYFLKCDVHHFFESIDHAKAKELVSEKISDEHIRQMIFEIINSFGGEKGIGLGSQVSQLLALMYLDKLDHIIKEKFGAEVFERYMDDIIIVDQSKEHLRDCLRRISEHLDSIGLSLNSKTTIQKLRKGVAFLNWRYILTDSGKVLMLPDKRRLTKKRHKLRAMRRKGLPAETIQQTLSGMIAHLSKGNAYRAINQLKKEEST